MMPQANSPFRTMFTHSVATVIRERTVTILALLFLLLIMVSAYLGWSATNTVNAVYESASAFLKANSQPVPPNPVLETSPLALLRNMATYVSLIGSLAAIVVGYQLIATDRKAGIMPLLGTRPVTVLSYGFAKIAALFVIILALMIFSALISTGTFLILPAFHLAPDGWWRLVAFFAASAAYMALFGLMGLGFGAWAESETVGLLVPITAWLSLTFILPQLTSNINPVAALNPVSALAAPPQSLFFQITGRFVEPVSLAESYRTIAAGLLDFLPPDFVQRSLIDPFVSLGIAAVLLTLFAAMTIRRLDLTHGDYNG